MRIDPANGVSVFNKAALPAVLMLATAAVACAILFDATPLLRGPAPYPPEWQWIDQPKDTLARGGMALACAGGLLGLLAVSGLALARRHPVKTCALMLATATLLGLGLQWGMLKLEKNDAVETYLQRTISGSFTSYYLVAISPEADDPWAFLDHHAELLPGFRERVGHAATHPPGPVLFFRCLLGLCRWSAALTNGIIDTIARPRLDMRTFTLPEEGPLLATALLAPLVLGLFCAAACFPTAALAYAAGMRPLPAARVGVLWSLLPGPMLMVPSIDAALALPIVGAAAILAFCVTRRPATKRVVLGAIGAGLLGGIALFTSYGAAAFLVIGCGAAAALGKDRSRIIFLLGLTAIVALSVNLLPMLAGHDPLAAARTALAIHRDAYTAPRSYALWLLFNAWDFALFLGVPVAVLGVWRGVRAVVRCARASRSSAIHPFCRFQTVAGLGLAALLMSGVVRGEVGRLWIPLMPILLVVSLGRAACRVSAPLEGWRVSGPSARRAVLLGMLLFVLSIVIRLTWLVP